MWKNLGLIRLVIGHQFVSDTHFIKQKPSITGVAMNKNTVVLSEFVRGQINKSYKLLEATVHGK